MAFEWKGDVLGNLGEKSPLPHTIGSDFTLKYCLNTSDNQVNREKH